MSPLLSGDNKEINKKHKLKIKNTSGYKKRMDIRWLLIVTPCAFVASVGLSMVSGTVIPRADLWVAVLILLLFIFIGIVFDIVGIAVTSASEKPFHSMAARKITGARHSVILIRNAEKVSNFCNDVVGDIAGIVSGSTVGVLVTYLTGSVEGTDSLWATLMLTGLVASFTIGGKAAGKSIAINNSNTIVYCVGFLWSVLVKMLFWKKSGKDG